MVSAPWLAAAPPADGDAGSPFQAKTHTAQAILCGDFNLEASAPEYAAITAGDLHDAWRALHGAQPQPATFRLFDRSYGPEPVACDFVFVSAGLLPRLRDRLAQHADARCRVEWLVAAQ